nr:PAS domain S-box protein [uncultured Desulfuromonas sp.]
MNSSSTSLLEHKQNERIAQSTVKGLCHLIDAVSRLGEVNDWTDLLPLIRKTTRELMHADGVTLVLRDDNRCHYVDEDAIGPLWKGQSFSLEDISGWVMLNNRATAIEDIYNDSRIQHGVYRPTFVQSLSMVPVGKTRVIGAMGCYWKERRTFSEDDLFLQQAVADAVSLSFANIKLKKQLEQDRVHSNLPYKLLVEQAPDAIFIFSSQGRVEEVNEAGRNLFGFSQTELVGKKFEDLLAPEDRDLADTLLINALQRSTVVQRVALLGKNRTKISCEMASKKLPGGYIESIIRDLGGSSERGEKHWETTALFRRILDTFPGMIFTSFPDGRYDYVSQLWIDYTGAPGETYLKNNWLSFLHPNDRHRIGLFWKNGFKPGRCRECREVQCRFRRHDNIYEWFYIIVRPVCDQKGNVYKRFGVAINIDKLKKTTTFLDESKILLRTIADGCQDSIFVIDQNHQLSFVNKACLSFIHQVRGYPKIALADILGMNIFEVFGENDVSRHLYKIDKRVMETGKSEITEDIFPTSTVKTCLTEHAPYRDIRGRITGVIGISRDISAVKMSHDLKLADIKQQCDVLVREAHHRIKNHLQGIVSLLRNAIADNPQICQPLEAAIDRIQTVSRIYDLQGRRGDARILFKDLMRMTIAGNTGGTGIVCNDKDLCRDYFLAQEEALPVALIVNELITNALKHLSAPIFSRPIRVLIKEHEDRLCVRIVNGPAFLPAGFDFSRGKKLGNGLELVSALLPSNGTTLTFSQSGDEVIAELCLPFESLCCCSDQQGKQER